MEGKLIKTEVNYLLEGEGGVVIASTSLKKEGMSLSLKNCQAIELGYDLDELAYSSFPNGTYETSEIDLGLDMYKLGFQKALEVMGDQKFSEEDMVDCWETAHQAGRFEGKGIAEKDWQTSREYIQSLQQTQWDVEVVMVPAMSNNGNVYYGDIPKLDAGGCLTLKII